MKFKILLVAILIVLAAVEAFAVGTVTLTSTNIMIQGVVKRKLVIVSWVGDASNGTVPDTAINADTYGIKGWYMYTGETDPGSPAPTDNYDIVVNDANGLDIAGGLLANRDTSTTEMVNFGTTSHGYPLVRGNLTFSLSNNSATSATGVLILTFISD